MSGIYEKLIRPVMFRLDAETAHEIGIESLRLGLANVFGGGTVDDPLLRTKKFGLVFKNPLGLAAGFDKNGVAVNQLARLGFGFVEVGTVTWRPQEGNEKPRIFRLPEDRALINRLGFNNDGVVAVADRLRRLSRRCVVGVNIGKNKDVPNEDAVENYLAAFEIAHPVADYIAVNISSPNTPGLRELQRADSLETLLAALLERNRDLARDRNTVDSTATRPSRIPDPDNMPGMDGSAIRGARSVGNTAAATGLPKPLLVKIAPDLSEADIDAIIDVCLRLGVSGVIAANTTVSRTGLRTKDAELIGAGGLSGLPLSKRANEIIRAVYHRSNGRIPIVGVGGIFTAIDAFEKIAAGASLLQAYTGFVYGGPSFAREVTLGLAGLLKDRGFASVDEAVGTARV